VAGPGDITKRILFGRPLRSADLGHTLLPKKLALPVFSSDALSSVAYATEEILLVLSLGGLAFFSYTPYIAVCVALLLAVVVLSYRQTVHAYPQGGGAYRVAHTNLGPNAGLVAASALLIDYVLTVSVSITAGVAAIASATDAVEDHRVLVAVGFITFITLMNLRGVKESGTFFAIPTYGFILGIGIMLLLGIARVLTGSDLEAVSANREIEAHDTYAGLALVFLIARAFASGCTALTGVEAISDGVPAFKKPSADNAAKTLLIMATLSISMFLGISFLAIQADVRISEDFHDGTVVSQIAQAVFGGRNAAFYYIQAFTAGILILAANTAYQDFPRISSILSQDRYLPRQFHNRGDRLVFSNGIILLAVASSLLIWAFDAELTRIIQLYIVGVFVSFTLSQYGMVKHWDRVAAEDPSLDRRTVRRSRLINLVGASVTFVVLIIVLFSKFTKGAWLVVAFMPVLFFLMRGIHRHYSNVARELRLAETRPVLPSRIHAVVLISSVHNATRRALNYARAIRPHTLEALYIAVDDEEAARLREEWAENITDVPLHVIDSPYREITKPVLDYVRRYPRGPRDVIAVIVPEFVVGKWWEQLLHNQSALRLKAALLFQPGVTLTSVPWHLSSAPEPESVTTGASDPPGAPAVPLADPSE
jgi:amino acid transporter